MPRGIPNAKLDDTSMRYTSFVVPPPLNPKHMGSTYLKSDSQTLWARNSARKAQFRAEEQPNPSTRRGSHVLVIHPGSRFTRVGRASDVFPVSVPTVLARKTRPPLPVPEFHENIARPRKSRPHSSREESQNADEYAVQVASDDPVEAKIAAITVSLRDRMRFYKLRVTPNASTVSSTFNEKFQPEIIPQQNDPFRVDWILESQDEVLVGEKALRLADPLDMGYVVRWPLHGADFNTRDYPSLQVILSDIETILRVTLEERLDIRANEHHLYAVVLIIPDFYERSYVREWAQLLLVTMGFKQICIQQESLAATYGAGISNACVVDIGAVRTSITCVDEGLVVSDTRMSLSMGGDDITEFLWVLLQRIGFPYRDLNLARSYDWDVMEDLKARLCTLAEGDVALNLYDFVVRRPGRPAEKYGLRAYDEIILAPMCVFEPRVVEFERKRMGFRPTSHPDVSDEIMEPVTDHITQAMAISTQHLMPTPPADLPVILVQPEASVVQPMDQDSGREDKMDVTPPEPVLGASADAPLEIIDVEDDAVEKNVVPNPGAARKANVYPSDYHIDICLEASKLPLDVAIFNSARSAGGDEKIRKYLQAVIVIGGGSLIPGMPHALESRLQAIATPLVPNMEKVQILPPPKDVDARVVVWKGGAVFGKMDGIADLWVTGSDWDILGMRGLKDRCFFLN